MSYFVGFVIAILMAKQQTFGDNTTAMDAMIIEIGATGILECWGDDYRLNALDPQGAAFALVGARP